MSGLMQLSNCTGAQLSIRSLPFHSAHLPSLPSRCLVLVRRLPLRLLQRT